MTGAQDEQGEKTCDGILVETFRESRNNALGLQADCGNTASLLSSRMYDLIFDSETVFDITQPFKDE